VHNFLCELYCSFNVKMLKHTRLIWSHTLDGLKMASFFPDVYRLCCQLCIELDKEMHTMYISLSMKKCVLWKESRKIALDISRNELWTTETKLYI